MVDRSDGFRGQPGVIGFRKRNQAEFLDQDVQRLVVRPVVDDHNFKFRIAQLEEGFDRGRDGRFLIEGRNEQRDLRFESGVAMREAVERTLFHVAPQMNRGDHIQHQVSCGQAEKVEQEQPFGNRYERVYPHRSACFHPPSGLPMDWLLYHMVELGARGRVGRGPAVTRTLRRYFGASLHSHPIRCF